MIHFRAFKKRYGSQIVFDIADFSLEDGVYWLQGQNGVGKTTLLRCIGGILPFDGDISFEGVSLKKSTANYLSMVNYAATEPVFPDFLSGKQIIDFFLKCKKTLATDYKELIASFGMEDYLQIPTGQYSSGMLKKLALVLTFIGPCRLLLLDEPFITLDVQAKQTMLQWLDYKRMDGTNILFSSHEEEQLIDTTPIAIQQSKLILL